MQGNGGRSCPGSEVEKSMSTTETQRHSEQQNLATDPTSPRLRRTSKHGWTRIFLKDLNISKKFFLCLCVSVVNFCFSGIAGAQNMAPNAPFGRGPTLTPTIAFTPNPTPTFTFTITPTGTQSPPPTPTPSHTPTATRTITDTPTISPTFTNSPTGTLSPSLTPTPTQTPTSTATKTPTRTPSATPTYTSTPGVFKFTVSPKPDAQGTIHFAWGTTIPSSEVFLRVYTSGFRLVWDENFNQDNQPQFLTSGDHDTYWNARDEEERPMPPGNYLCFISITVGKKNYEASSKTEIP